MADLTPMHLDALATESRELLERLAGRPWATEIYLAGSAALALYLEHRPVHGIDLMAPANRLAGPERRDLLTDLLEIDAAFRMETIGREEKLDEAGEAWDDLQREMDALLVAFRDFS